jgi:hypothetical protein
MPANITDTEIRDTYDQLLHIDEGPESTEKVVYSGTGVATALKLGTTSASVDNIRIDGNTISATNPGGGISLVPDGTGTVSIPNVSFGDPSQARAAMNLGTAALAGTGDFATAAQGALADSAVQPGDPTSVAFGNVTGRAHGIFYDLGDQTFTAATPTVVTFDTTGLAVGVSAVSNTRITFAAAGVYEIASRLQFANSDSADYLADVWFRLDGVDIPYSATEISVPRSTDGGKASHNINGILQVTAGQYLEVVVAVEDADTSLHYHAPLTTPYARPAVPSAILVANRIA